MKKTFLLALATLFASATASATDWSYSFVGHDAHGSQISASGFIDAAGDGTNPSLVTSMTGVFETKHGSHVTDSSISFIAPTHSGVNTSPSGTWYFDDMFAGAQDLTVDNAGLLFKIGGTEYNLYTDNGKYVLGFGNNLSSYELTSVKFIDDTVAAAVPEPSSLGLMLAGVTGLVAFRRRKQVV